MNKFQLPRPRFAPCLPCAANSSHPNTGVEIFDPGRGLLIEQNSFTGAPISLSVRRAFVFSPWRGHSAGQSVPRCELGDARFRLDFARRGRRGATASRRRSDGSGMGPAGVRAGLERTLDLFRRERVFREGAANHTPGACAPRASWRASWSGLSPVGGGSVVSGRPNR